MSGNTTHKGTSKFEADTSKCKGKQFFQLTISFALDLTLVIVITTRLICNCHYMASVPFHQSFNNVR